MKKVLSGAVIGMWLVFATAGSAVVIDTVPVGNPGNAGELSGEGAVGVGPDRICGAVGYEYRIGKYEVTAGQYTEFLNEVAGVDTYGLYNTAMSNTSSGSGITQTDANSDGLWEYSVASDFANRPVNFVSWGDAARFANWLHNGQPTGAQNLSTTEDGAYPLNGATTDAALLAVTRKPNTTWAITSEDEWYKAAYHKNDGATGNYFDYPTGNDTLPGRDMADVSGNNANYHGNPYPIDSGKYTTVVGEFQNSDSPYGTFDQGGNVWEWNEAILYGSSRGLSGGSFYSDGSYLHAARRGSNPFYMLNENPYFGFRVSKVPMLGDSDCDGDVDLADLGALAGAYGTTSGATWEMGDFNGDGDVDLVDLGTLAGNYGYGVPSPLNFAADVASYGLIPEPASMAILALGGLALIRRRKA